MIDVIQNGIPLGLKIAMLLLLAVGVFVYMAVLDFGGNQTSTTSPEGSSSKSVTSKVLTVAGGGVLIVVGMAFILVTLISWEPEINRALLGS